MLLLLLGQVKPELVELGTQRGQFEAILRKSSHYAVETIGTMAMASEGWSWALFPKGRADVRFLVDEFGDGPYLVYQVRKGKFTKSAWKLRLTGHASRQLPGTVALILHNHGLFVKGPLTKFQRSALIPKVGYAFYTIHSIGEALKTSYIDASGRETSDGLIYGDPTPKKLPYPIPEGEVKALGMGSASWIPADLSH